ncbi:ricin-type beta-trefoil lectin domain protein [Granulicella sp. WH15]|uniref:ricin-type beta-trefoil lectin domain protein n=1 Tax=Granulicella sp. WH15 TaxID=2602070 RepID=UPI001366D880|nr:ricin-type beta-trefoil lectin domain protein [Granulicella sp. WH15]QHN03249.1 ricin-type beta-trefoil lectin domain protein [Granulicella sp. WH15]
MTWTGSYFVWSALNGYSGDTSYGLNVQGAVASAGTPIILYPWGGGQPNELWQYTNNQFVSNLASNLVIGFGTPLPDSPGNYNLALVEQNLNDPSQMWNVDAATGLITNVQYPDLYMNVSGDELTANAAIITYSLQEGNSNEIWTLVPAWAAPPAGAASTPMPTWCYIQSGLSPYENDDIIPYLLTIQGSTPVQGNQVILETFSSNSAPMQMWQFASDQRILCLQGPANALTLGASSSDGGWEVTVNSQKSPVSDGQRWNLGGEAANQIENVQVSQSLVVAGGSSEPVSPVGEPLVEVVAGTANLSYDWYAIPSNPLDAILAQAPVPFPAFTGDQLIAYQYINQRLGLGTGDTPDLRGQYLNSTNYMLFGIWWSDILSYDPPTGVSEEDWDVVVNQLGAEITDVSAVQTVFSNYVAWHNAQFADNGTVLNGLIDRAQMEQSASTSGIGLALAQGALYTVLEAIPVVGNVLGNVVNTVITAALAAQTVSPTPFQVAVSELWSELSQTFLALFGQAALVETIILSDWGKLQATYPLTQLAQGAPGSLSADALSNANLLSTSTTGYTIAAMQILLPAQFQIYVYQDDNDDPVDDIPAFAQMILPAGNNLWTKYWIANSTDWDLYPAKNSLQNDVWDNGVATWDFFTGANGWGFAICYVYDFVVEGYDAVVVNVTNQTGNLLTAQVSITGGVIKQAPGTISPYMSSSFAANADGTLNPTLNFEIFDPNISTETAVASFTAVQPLAGSTGGWPTVSNQSTNNGYSFSNPICNQAAIQGIFKDGYPGAVQISLYRS